MQKKKQGSKIGRVLARKLPQQGRQTEPSNGKRQECSVHHNSTDVDYNHNAFGNISRDGRFLAWTSDWGNTGGRAPYIWLRSRRLPMPQPVV
jgi:hypothetical protein